MATEQGYQTSHYKHISAPREAMAIVKRQASLFRNVTEYQAGDGIACVFEYRAKDGSWQWGWAPHEAQYLLSTWLRRLYKATDKQGAIDKALESIDWQGREATARLRLLEGM